jgi:uncharacterized protein YdhG (YjbR/CyaY superfamily)
MEAKRATRPKAASGSKASNRSKPTTIDEYLAPLSDDKRVTLERLRAIIHDLAPDAEECISYGIPGFRLDGRCFVWIGAGAGHCAIYGLQSDAEELKGYDTSGKGTLRFKPENPPPEHLVRKLVKARIPKRSTAK